MRWFGRGRIIMQLHQKVTEMEGTPVVYVVDDDAGSRRSSCAAVHDLGYVARPFADGQDFVDALDYLVPGVVLLDLRMTMLSGLDVLEVIDGRKREFPCVLTSEHADVGGAVAAMKRGAADVIERPFDHAVLAAALAGARCQVMVDARPVPDLDTAIARQAPVLTARQLAVLKAMIVGHPNKEIARDLGIAPRTVEMHRAAVMHRLQARNLADLIQRVLLNG